MAAAIAPTGTIPATTSFAAFASGRRSGCERHRDLDVGIETLQRDHEGDREQQHRPFAGAEPEQRGRHEDRHRGGDVDPKAPLGAKQVAESVDRAPERVPHFGSVRPATSGTHATYWGNEQWTRLDSGQRDTPPG